MTLPYVEYPDATGTGPFAVPFSYREQVDVAAYLKADPETPVEFTWASGSTVTMDDALDGTDTLVIYRSTPVDQPVVTFQRGSVSAQDLNDQVRQLRMRLEEGASALTALMLMEDQAAAAAALADTLQAIADAPNLVPNKLNKTGSDIGDNGPTFRANTGTDLASNIYFDDDKDRTVQEYIGPTINLLKHIPIPVDITTADITPYLRLAEADCVATGLPLRVPLGYSFLVETFDQTLSSLSVVAVKLTGSLRVILEGSFKSVTAASNRSIFGVDETSGTDIDVIIRGGYVQGPGRFYLLRTAPLAVIRHLEWVDCITERQGVQLSGRVTQVLRINRNTLGMTTGAGIAHSPSINVTLTPDLDDNFAADVSDNIVRTGTDVIAGAFVLHGLPAGTSCDKNKHINVEGVLVEGFDIDNFARFATFTDNFGIFSGFEFKEGTAGPAFSRDPIISGNVSYKSWQPAFSFRTSMIGVNNLAYDPASWALYCADYGTGIADVHLDIDGFRIIWAGSRTSVGLVRIDAGPKRIRAKRVTVTIDPAYKAANPSAVLPGKGIRCEGTLAVAQDIVFEDFILDDTTEEQFYIRPGSGGARVSLVRPSMGSSSTEHLIDINNVDDGTIESPVWRGTPGAGKLPINMNSCERWRITNTPFIDKLDDVWGVGTNLGILINGLGKEAAGIGSLPLTDATWPLGAIVENTDDSTAWLRRSDSAVAATAYLQIA